MLESRELARKFRSPFSIKMNMDRSRDPIPGYASLNSSYRRIDHSLLTDPKTREKSFIQEKNVQVDRVLGIADRFIRIGSGCWLLDCLMSCR